MYKTKMAKRRGARVHRRTIRGGENTFVWDGRERQSGGGRKKMMRTNRRTRRGGRPPFVFPARERQSGGGRKKMIRTRRRTRRGGLAGNIGAATADVRRFLFH